MSLLDRWTETLNTLRMQGRYRSFSPPNGLDLTSNDYLGYGNHAENARATNSLSHSGLASRLLRGDHPIWAEVESQLKSWHNSPAILMMNSGYAANEGLISTIIEPGDWVAADELSHACIVDGLRLARCRRFGFRHNDVAHLEEGLRNETARPDPERNRFIITESLFSMDGDLAPLAEIAALAKRYSAHLIVDEAHSTGCFGPAGSGMIDELGLRESVLASVHTGGKALAVPGAYIACGTLLKEYLINRCRHLIFTTALPPECGRWWLERPIPQIQADESARASLHRNAEQFRAVLRDRGIAPLGSHYIVPIVLGDDSPAVAAARKLQQLGYDIRAIRPPSVAPGTARLRISLHAVHQPAMLQQLAEDLHATLRHTEP